MLSARNIKRGRDAVLAGHRLTSPEWFILGIISEQRSVTAKDLAQELQANPTYITATLGKLKNKKLITSKQSISDNRLRVLSLTAQGKTLVEAVGRGVAAAIDESFGHLGDEAVKHYFAVTQAISEAPENRRI